MANNIGKTALVYCQSGGGKTYNSLQIPGKKVLISTDRSYQFALGAAKDVTVLDCERWLPGDKPCFRELWDQAVAMKPAVIIIDNLSDLIDLAVLELIGSDGAAKDNRQSYQKVYLDIRRLTREANYLGGINVLWTAWMLIEEIQLPDGSKVQQFKPKLPGKISDNICGLCNIVGLIQTMEKNNKKFWYYNLTPNANVIAKDQIYNRALCSPAQLFSAPKTEVKNNEKA